MPGSLLGQHSPELRGGRHSRAALLAAAKERELQHLSSSQRDLRLVLSGESSISPLTDLQQADHGLESAFPHISSMMGDSVLAPWHPFPSTLAILLSSLNSAFRLGCTLKEQWLYFSGGLHNPCAQSVLQ